ncbi:MAG: hypothetical protein KC547_12540 [Anaerolineae bacterium]|nr:hypothetical protein [Anaerolineae bacterium]MCA9910448.1 hypothetical protein [Anaerolineae bacterium]
MSSQAEQYKSRVIEKIDRLLTEFAEGRVSREQFHAIYEHYNNQLNLAESLDIPTGNSEDPNAPGATIAIRHAHMGKALGMMIYHNKSGTFVDTLGDFDIETSALAPTLNDFSLMMDAGEFIDRRVRKHRDERWLLFAPGKYTTAIVLFHHEPSPQQMREVERLHHDFELANAASLRTAGRVNNGRLAYPFIIILQKKLKLK